MFILTESVQTGNNFHFKAKIFDIGFEPLPSSHEAFDSDGFERREEEAIEAKKQEAKNEIAAKPSSIDDLLVPSGMLGLAALAIDSYYGNKKAIPITNRMLDYIFIPSASRFNVLNDNYRISIFHKPIELIPYAKGYSIAWFDADYSAQDYRPLQEIKGILPYSEIKPVNYMHIPRLYSALFADREALPYIAAKNYYDAFEPKIAEIKPVDGIKITDTYLPHAAYSSMEENYETRIKPINYSRAFTKAIAENAVQAPITNIPIQIKTHHAKTPLTDNSPRLLEEVVEESPEISHKAALYQGNNPTYIFLPKHQNDNERKNYDTDISDAVVQMLDSNQEQAAIYSGNPNPQSSSLEEKTHEEPTNDNITESDDEQHISGHKDPKQNRNFTAERRQRKAAKKLPGPKRNYDPKENSRNKKPDFFNYMGLTINRQAMNSGILEQAMAWLSQIKMMEETFGSTASFAYYDKKTNAYVGYKDDLPMQAGSLPKIAIMYAILYLSEKGDLSLNDAVKNTESKKRRIGTVRGMETFTKSEYSVLELLNYAVKDSSNYATNLLLAYIGRRKINSILDELGFGQIQLKGFYKDGMQHENNRITTRAMAFLQYDMLNSDTLNHESKQIPKGAMKCTKGYLYDDAPELTKIGHSKYSMGVVSDFSGEASRITVLNTNFAKGIHDENFHFNAYGINSYNEFVKTHRSINNAPKPQKAA